MRTEVVASGLASSKPQPLPEAVISLQGTLRIGHAVRRYRCIVLSGKAKGSRMQSCARRTRTKARIRI